MTGTPGDVRLTTITRNREYLNRCVRNARDEVETKKDSLRAAQLALDEFELRHRPTYPTAEQRLALERAVEDVKNGYVPTSHLGRNLGDGVTVHGKHGFIMVDPQSPWGHAGNGKLWKLTEGEVEEIIAHVQSLGVTVTKHWVHEGVSLVVSRP